MTPRATAILNYLMYQVGWVAVVGGAASGYDVAGTLVGVALIALHLGLSRAPWSDLRRVALAAAIGLAVETWQVHSGTYRLLGGRAPQSWPPVWLIVLWAQFATTFRYSLAGVLARPRVAAAFGAIGGPLAFLAGERLGAVELAIPIAPGLVRLAVSWMCALLVFSWTRQDPLMDGVPRYREMRVSDGS